MREGTGEPPLPTTEAEVRRLFTPRFTFVEAYATSAARRQGLEWMVLARLQRPDAGQ